MTAPERITLLPSYTAFGDAILEPQHTIDSSSGITFARLEPVSPIMTISSDGVVTFSDRLTPAEAAREAWGLLMGIANEHNARIAELEGERDAAVNDALERAAKACEADAGGDIDEYDCGRNHGYLGAARLIRALMTTTKDNSQP